MVIAWDLYPERLVGDEPEPIEVVPYPLSDLMQLITRADVCEGRSIAALFMVREWLAGNYQASEPVLDLSLNRETHYD